MELGYEGYGLFWAIVEYLAQNSGEYQLSRLPQLYYKLQANPIQVNRVLNDFELFEVNQEAGTFTNRRLTEFLQKDLAKRTTLSLNAKQKPTKSKAKAKQKVKAAEASSTNQDNVPVYPFNTPTFIKAWLNWKAYRTEIKKPYKTLASEQAALDQLGKYNEAFALELIARSIANAWQGLVFEGTDKEYRNFLNPKKNGAPERTSFNGLTAN
jgi:hypothetical protein